MAAVAAEGQICRRGAAGRPRQYPGPVRQIVDDDSRVPGDGAAAIGDRQVRDQGIAADVGAGAREPPAAVQTDNGCRGANRPAPPVRRCLGDFERHRGLARGPGGVQVPKDMAAPAEFRAAQAPVGLRRAPRSANVAVQEDRAGQRGSRDRENSQVGHGGAGLHVQVPSAGVEDAPRLGPGMRRFDAGDAEREAAVRLNRRLEDGDRVGSEHGSGQFAVVVQSAADCGGDDGQRPSGIAPQQHLGFQTAAEVDWQQCIHRGDLETFQPRGRVDDAARQFPPAAGADGAGRHLQRGGHDRDCRRRPGPGGARVSAVADDVAQFRRKTDALAVSFDCERVALERAARRDSLGDPHAAGSGDAVEIEGGLEPRGGNRALGDNPGRRRRDVEGAHRRQRRRTQQLERNRRGERTVGQREFAVAAHAQSGRFQDRVGHDKVDAVPSRAGRDADLRRRERPEPLRQ